MRPKLLSGDSRCAFSEQLDRNPTVRLQALHRPFCTSTVLVATAGEIFRGPHGANFHRQTHTQSLQLITHRHGTSHGQALVIGTVAQAIGVPHQFQDLMFVRSMALQHLGKVHQLLTIFGQDVGHARTVESETHIQCRHGGRFDHRRGHSRLLDGGCNDLLGLALGGQFFSLFRQIFSNLDIGAGMAPATLANLVAGMHQLHLGTRQTLGGTLHAFGVLTSGF